MFTSGRQQPLRRPARESRRHVLAGFNTITAFDVGSLMCRLSSVQVCIVHVAVLPLGVCSMFCAIQRLQLALNNGLATLLCGLSVSALGSFARCSSAKLVHARVDGWHHGWWYGCVLSRRGTCSSVGVWTQWRCNCRCHPCSHTTIWRYLSAAGRRNDLCLRSQCLVSLCNQLAYVRLQLSALSL